MRGKPIATDSKVPHPGIGPDTESSCLSERLAQAQRRIAELQHLIRDTSQIALGVVSIVASRRNTAESKTLAKDIRLRVGAIGVAVAASEDGMVDISGSIEKLAHEAAAMFGRQRIGLRLDLAPVRVPERAAVSIAIAVVELLTNAYQHAFVDRPFGLVEVKLAPRANLWASVCIADNGIGLRPEIAANWPNVLPGGKNSGLATASGLVRSLGGQLHLTCLGGTTFEFSFPTA